MGELSPVCDSLSFRRAAQDAKGRATIELVGIAFAGVPFAELAFSTRADAFAELSALGPVVALADLCGGAVVEVVRGVLQGILFGFATLWPLTTIPLLLTHTCLGLFNSEPLPEVSRWSCC